MTVAWETKRIGDICEVIAGQSPEGKFYNKVGKGMPFYQGKKDFGERFIEVPTTWTTNVTKVAKKDDVLMSVRAPVGPINFSTGEICIGRGLAAIRATPKIDKDFLFSFLLKNESEIVGNAGAVFSSINKNQIENIPLLLPPLPEQKRIVSILDKACTAIAAAKENAERNLKNSKSAFESYLQSIFSVRKQGWEDRKLSSLCVDITVGHVGSMATEYKTEGIPFLRSQNIRPFRIDMENIRYIDGNFHQALKKSKLLPGDLAVVRTGYPGTAAVIPSDLPDSNCSDLVIFRPGKEINPHYLAAFFNSAYGKNLVLGKIVGAAQKHFNIGAAKEVVIHLPSKKEQSDFVSKLDALSNEIEKLTNIQARKIAGLDELKNSILQKAFAGELNGVTA